MLGQRARHIGYQLIFTVKNYRGLHQNLVNRALLLEFHCFRTTIYRNQCTTTTAVLSKGMLPQRVQSVPNVSIQNFSNDTKVANKTESNATAHKHAMDDPKITIEETVDTKKITMKDKLKKAVKEYGSTVIVFHVSISLLSLGTCYFLVSTGLDVVNVLQAIGLQDWAAKSQLAANAGTFAVAYVIHKAFAPLRITITLGSVPFIVRYLRRVGFLK